MFVFAFASFICACACGPRVVLSCLDFALLSYPCGAEPTVLNATLFCSTLYTAYALGSSYSIQRHTIHTHKHRLFSTNNRIQPKVHNRPKTGKQRGPSWLSPTTLPHHTTKALLSFLEGRGVVCVCLCNRNKG